MSTERDILAGRINAAIEEWDDAEPGKYAAHVAGHVADAILAAGYRKTRTISTVEELDALPVGSVVLDGSGLSLHRNEFTGWGASNGTKNISNEMFRQEMEVFPITVLHEPS